MPRQYLSKDAKKLGVKLQAQDMDFTAIIPSVMVSLVTVTELMRVGDQIIATSFNAFSVYTSIALMYLIMTSVFMILSDVLKMSEKVVILGPSGSGKSTILRCIKHLEEFQEGSICFKGKKVNHSELNSLRTNIGKRENKIFYKQDFIKINTLLKKQECIIFMMHSCFLISY